MFISTLGTCVSTFSLDRIQALTRTLTLRYSSATPFVWHQTTHGRAFVMGRSDWEYVFNTFAFAYAIGYHFIARAKGSMNGNFLGIGQDRSR